MLTRLSACTEPRPQIAYHSTIPPPVEDQYWARARNLDAPRLRDIRKRLEAPASQVPQAEVDALASELIEDIVPLASDYIGNVIVQKLFEKASSGSRVRSAYFRFRDATDPGLQMAMLERLAPFLASIACHKNGTWAAQKILYVSPDEDRLPVLIICVSGTSSRLLRKSPLLVITCKHSYLLCCSISMATMPRSCACASFLQCPTSSSMRWSIAAGKWICPVCDNVWY